MVNVSLSRRIDLEESNAKSGEQVPKHTLYYSRPDTLLESLCLGRVLVGKEDTCYTRLLGSYFGWVELKEKGILFKK